MKTIDILSAETWEELTIEGIQLICDKNMNFKITDEDFERIKTEFSFAMDDIIVINE